MRHPAAQDIPGGSYVGPDGFQEQRGHPTHVTPHNREAYDEGIAGQEK